MTNDPTPCELVAERCALGEPLADLADHAAGCETCKGLVGTATALGATKHDVDPGMGFSARMTVATQTRLAERKRNRIVGGVASSVVAGVVAVFAMTRGPGALPDRPEPALAPHQDKQDPTDPTDPTDTPTDDTEALRALARFGNVDTNAHLSAHWGHIERPLAPYRRLVRKAVK